MTTDSSLLHKFKEIQHLPCYSLTHTFFQMIDLIQWRGLIGSFNRKCTCTLSPQREACFGIYLEKFLHPRSFVMVDLALWRARIGIFNSTQHWIHSTQARFVPLPSNILYPCIFFMIHLGGQELGSSTARTTASFLHTSDRDFAPL